MLYHVLSCFAIFYMRYMFCWWKPHPSIWSVGGREWVCTRSSCCLDMSSWICLTISALVSSKHSLVESSHPLLPEVWSTWRCVSIMWNCETTKQFSVSRAMGSGGLLSLGHTTVNTFEKPKQVRPSRWMHLNIWVTLILGSMMKETFSKTYSERYKIHSVPFYRGFVKTITAARPHTMHGTIWDNTHQVPALCATQVKSWAGTTPEEERQPRRCRRYRGRSSATNIKNPRCRGTSSAISEYTKYKSIYKYIQHRHNNATRWTAQNRCDQAPEDSTWQAKCDIIKKQKTREPNPSANRPPVLNTFYLCHQRPRCKPS